MAHRHGSVFKTDSPPLRATLLNWRSRQESNLLPLASEASALLQ